MIYRRRLTGTAPADQDEFERKVIEAIRVMNQEGSVYISHMDICYYNNWICNVGTSRRIGMFLKRKLALIKVNTRNSYKIPEAA